MSLGSRRRSRRAPRRTADVGSRRLADGGWSRVTAVGVGGPRQWSVMRSHDRRCTTTSPAHRPQRWGVWRAAGPRASRAGRAAHRRGQALRAVRTTDPRRAGPRARARHRRARALLARAISRRCAIMTRAIARVDGARRPSACPRQTRRRGGLTGQPRPATPSGAPARDETTRRTAAPFDRLEAR